MKDKECSCGYNQNDPTDQCYCPYIPKPKIRVVTPLPEDERISDDNLIMDDHMCFGAWLASMDLLTPG